MANNTGTLVISPIRPQAAEDTFASAYANEIKGGHHQVADLTARNAITTDRRTEGMLCWVISESKMYRLVGGITNDDWVETTTQGPQGPQGAQGAQGNQGNQGSQGTQGPQGTDGDPGNQGYQGYQGNQGNQGNQGYQGVQGAQGNQGYQGDTGNQGNQGHQGSAGAQGNQGNQGNQGSAGAQGNQGNQGNQGSAGTGLTNRGAWVASTSYSPGDYVFDRSTNDPDVNSMWICQVAVSGTTHPYQDLTHWVEFAAPEGPQGDQGAQGNQGYQGTQGVQGTQGNQGNQGAQGTQGNQGDAGPQGNQGNQGSQGNQGVQGSQGNQGSQGSGYKATSTDTVLIGTGEKTFTTQSGLAYTIGSRVRAASISSPSSWVEGVVTDYTGTSLVITADLTSGSGNKNDWNINIAGQTGAQGNQGNQGNAGAQGTQGAQGNQGNQGNTGAQGISGPQGTQGNQGNQGNQGVAGQDGDEGPQGPQGVPGTGVNINWDQPLYYNSGTETAYLGYSTADFAIINGELRLYVAPTVSLSGGSTNEIGSTVANVALTWTCNKSMTTRVLSAPVPTGDRDRGAGQNGSYTHTGANLTTNTTYTITVGDGVNTAQGTTSVNFRSKRYWGTSASTSLNDAGILALSGELATSRGKSFTQNGNGQYIYYVYPASWGAATFTVNGLLNTDWTLTTQTHVNASGYSTSYYVYRTNTIQNGTGISIVVS